MEAINECRLCNDGNVCNRTYTIGEPTARIIIDKKGRQTLAAGSIQDCAKRSQILANIEEIRQSLSL